MKVDRYKVHDIEIVIDKITVSEENRRRISEAVKTAMKYGKGAVMVMDEPKNELRHYSKALMCPESGVSYPEPEPNTFSFNSLTGHVRNVMGWAPFRKWT